MAIRLTLVILVLKFGMCVDVFAAEIVVEANPNDNSIIWIIGEIERGDFEKFRSAIRSGDSRGLRTVELRSPGGSAFEAMNIGREIRRNFLQTKAPLILPGEGLTVSPFPKAMLSKLSLAERQTLSYCNSACFLIWAGGVIRLGVGREPLMDIPGTLGLHRPTFDSKTFSELSVKKAEDLYDEMLMQIEEYLVEMNIADSMIEKMVAVPSSEVYFPTSDELKPHGTTPFFDEWLRNKCGESLSTEQHLQMIFLEGRQKRGHALEADEESYLFAAKLRNDTYQRCKKNAVIHEQNMRLKK